MLDFVCARARVCMMMCLHGGVMRTYVSGPEEPKC